ncbi:MAG: UDP-N-acetylmuramate--L-alanine ligase [Patescibacteria group bacterium]|nr:UDP-N-acetylmuramate--L-alanine ligase [Patescibacteria group bacterium]
MDWSKVKSVYMIGIKGVGMTMLAEFLAAQGIKVEGSDGPEHYFTEKVLTKAKIKFYEQFSESNLPSDVDLIIYSTAYNESNPEVKAAINSNKKVFTYAEALAKVFNYRQGIAVCGSHGKTTTTAWLGFVMDKLKMKPNVMVGSIVPQFGGASLSNSSDWLVIEADEYQNKLKQFEPKAILLNNIDYDHPDFYKTEKDYFQAFADFVIKLTAKGWLVANFDDANVREVAKLTKAKVISYAIESEADLMASDLAIQGGRQYFKAKYNGEDLGSFNISLLGKHNVYNALAVIASVLEIGADLLGLRNALAEFNGTVRRMEYKGEYKGARIYDDYAHHPTEVKASIQAALEIKSGAPLYVVFHPHTFTRTKALLDDFAKSFTGVEKLCVIEIYGSAREIQGGVSSNDLVEKIKINNPKIIADYVPDLPAAANWLNHEIQGGETVVLMGAGDVNRLATEFLSLEYENNQ